MPEHMRLYQWTIRPAEGPASPKLAFLRVSSVLHGPRLLELLHQIWRSTLVPMAHLSQLQHLQQ